MNTTNPTTNDILATDTPATMRAFLIIQMRETCEQEQIIEGALKVERNKEARQRIESDLEIARIEHRKATLAFMDFLKGNPPVMRPVTNLNLSK